MATANSLFLCDNQYFIESSKRNKGLGVSCDSKFGISYHIDNICKNASKLLGFLQRNSTAFENVNTIKLIYNSLVRSQLKYATQIWNTIYNLYTDRIERIQRKFT